MVLSTSRVHRKRICFFPFDRVIYRHYVSSYLGRFESSCFFSAT